VPSRDRDDEVRDYDDWPVRGSRPTGRSGPAVLLIVLIGVGALGGIVVLAAAGLFLFRAAPAPPPQPVALPAPAGGPMAGGGGMMGPAELPAKGMAPEFRPPPELMRGAPLGKAVFSLDAVEFAKEYTKDKAAFEKKYGSRTIELTGEVKDVGEDIVGNGTVTLKGDPDVLVGSVLCQVPGGAPWRRVLPGQTVRVRGRCPEGGLVMAMIQNCEFLAVNGDPPPLVLANTLAHEFAAGPEAAEKKWQNKYLILSGRIKEVKPPAGLNGTIYLFESDPAAPKVETVFGLIYEDRVNKRRAGEQVRVLVKVLGLTAEKDRLLLSECCLLDR
jgi:hypothetical protein